MATTVRVVCFLSNGSTKAQKVTSESDLRAKRLARDVTNDYLDESGLRDVSVVHVATESELRNALYAATSVR